MILICQLPWIIITAFLCTAAQQRRVAIDTAQWVLWGLIHLLGLHFFIGIFTYEIPLESSLSIGTTETLAGAGSIIAYWFLKKNWIGAVPVLFFWNTFGLMSSWKLNSGIQLYFYSGPSIPGQRETADYFLEFPQIWLISFWIPLCLCLHICIFYSMWLNRRGAKERSDFSN
jgi:hypothetical protein